MQPDVRGAGRESSLVTFPLTLAFFVSPLLFFTDLTRNPYYLQIALLNAALVAAFLVRLGAMARAGEWRVSRNLLWPSLLALSSVLLLSWARSFFMHEPFFRPAIFSEGLRAFLFLFVNCGLAFWLSSSVPWGDGPQTRTGPYLFLLLVWGGAWAFFPFLRSQSPGAGFWERFWDPYGGVLWLTGLAAAWRAVRGGTQSDYLNLALTAGALASVYGILQYFGVELVWLKALNPYGNRSVSTFGNPNFISSYVVVLAPLALVCWLEARTAAARSFYAAVLLSYEGMLLASLTRSSWLGMAAGLVFLAAVPAVRSRALAAGRRGAVLAALVLGLAALWPVSSSAPLGTGLVQRLSEGAGRIVSSGDLSLSVSKERLYGSFHQRVLIWTSAWQMGLESPLLGKGWGNFELFYPFFQGNLLAEYEGVRGLRTHANNAHNELLEIWAQAGLAGLAAFFLALTALAAAYLRHLRSAPPETALWTTALAAGVVGMFADNMLNVSLHFAVPGFAFWWVLGAFSSRLSGHPAAVPAPWRRLWAGRAAAAALLLFALGALYYWQAQFRREALYFSGFKLMRRGDARAAAAELERAHSAWPREVNTNYELGNAHVRTGDYPAAILAYGEALKSNPGYDEIFFNLAVIQKKTGAFADAARNLRLSALINPLNTQTYHAAAEVYASSPSVHAAEAVRLLSGAARIFPADPSFRNLLGYFHSVLGDHRAAADAYGRAVRLDPYNKTSESNLRGTAAAAGQARNGHLRWLGFYREAERLLQTGNPKDALAYADRLLDGEGGEARARYLISKARFASGDLRGAREELTLTLAADPDHNEARYGLAALLERSGETEAAARQWELLLQREPGNAKAAERLAALRREGQ